ncbi:MAG: OsmC family protein [Candidatus Marinimicrobia bacterium]|nr:OsmC family protein [Candidatus Neomarinimicrobiota bacterium]
MTGTFGGALEARKIKSAPDRLFSEVEGDIESIDGVLRITKIRVIYHLKYAGDEEEKVQRAFKSHPLKCPAYMTLRDVVEFTLSLKLVS